MLSFTWSLKKKNQQTHRYRGQRGGAGGGVGKKGGGGRKVRTSSYKISQGDAAHSPLTVVNKTVLHVRKVLRAILTCSHPKKNCVSICGSGG